MRYFAGVDWGTEAHAIGVVDDGGGVVGQFEIDHNAEGIETMLARLARFAPAAELLIAIERPLGLVIDALIEAGHPVAPLHPNVALPTARPSHASPASSTIRDQ